jgi:glutamate N-acetyltransferase/amino-acid N-acetyltransferase
VACGIKKSNGLDLALIVSDTPASGAAVFTTNKAVAAPVLVSKARLRASGGHSRLVVINSGCANACTGPEGRRTAEAMADAAALAVHVDASQVLVASTGVIGVALDRRRVTDGIAAAAAVLSRDGGAAAARAIMTTDPFPKEAAVEVTMPAGRFRIGGIAKGSGMIEPMMATMLAVVTTDAQVEPGLLQRALTAVTDVTFNAITVDGECSTNDCVFALANGASGVTIAERDFDLFVAALRQVCEPLAIGIVRGGEGATKLVTIEVTGGATNDEAKRAARAIANSPLVKTAVHGADPNWGRLVAVAGRAGVEFDLDRARVQIGDVELFAGGRPFDERAPQASEHLQGADVTLRVDLGTGKSGAARMWTCDLSAEYVKINAEYRT